TDLRDWTSGWTPHMLLVQLNSIPTMTRCVAHTGAPMCDLMAGFNQGPTTRQRLLWSPPSPSHHLLPAEEALERSRWIPAVESLGMGRDARLVR
ncbi:Hypothetical predicted protein, partial [Pelobates cultripes]